MSMWHLYGATFSMTDSSSVKNWPVTCAKPGRYNNRTATGQRRHKLPSSTLTIDGTAVSASSSVCDLGMHIDADLVMRMYVQKTVSCCFAVLRPLRQIRRSVPQPTFQSLMVTLVSSQLDYGKGALIGLRTYLVDSRQSVLNAAAWLIFNLRHSNHVSDAVIILHWLSVPECIGSKVAVQVY